MKKLIALAFCGLAVMSVSAQVENLKAAKKLVGKADKIEEVRSLLQQAKNDPTTANDPETYFIAGDAEFKALENMQLAAALDPKKADAMKMADWALRGYKEMMAVLPMDSTPDAKGQIKPKFSGKAIDRINKHINDYPNAGSDYYNAKMYPEAYEAFMVYGTFPKSPYANKGTQAIPDTMINKNLYFAGLSAYAANDVPGAIKAFSLARKNNSDELQNYIYEIACWQNLMRTDTTTRDAATAALEEISYDGLAKFGNTNPAFISNLVDIKTGQGKFDDAMKIVEDQIAKEGKTASLLSLEAFISNRQGNTDDAVAKYREAASMADADFDVLKRAAALLYKVGVAKNNELNPADKAGKDQVKAEYFQVAMDAIEKAKTLNPKDSDIAQMEDAISYILETYFK